MQDKFSKKAKKEGFLARSAYKLIDLNKKYKLIKKDDIVLDLGCSPGSWVQVALKLKAERIIGIDIQEAKFKDKNFEFILEDIYNLDTSKIGKFDVVLSDLAPATTGIKNIDTEKSIELSKKAFEITKQVLKQGGNFLCKVFQGATFNDLLKDIKNNFEFCKCSKPIASKKTSKEIYIVAKGFSTNE